MIILKIIAVNTPWFVTIGFFNCGLKCEYSLCNGCHDWTVLCLSIGDIAFISVKNVDYYWIIHAISKSEAINLLKNYVLGNLGYIWKCISKKSILKIWVYRYYFDDLMKAKKLETKNKILQGFDDLFTVNQ